MQPYAKVLYNLVNSVHSKLKRFFLSKLSLHLLTLFSIKDFVSYRNMLAVTVLQSHLVNGFFKVFSMLISEVAWIS